MLIAGNGLLMVKQKTCNLFFGNILEYMCIYVLDEWNDMLASSDRWSSSTSSPFHSFIIPEQIIQFNNKEFKEDEHWAAWEPVQAFFSPPDVASCPLIVHHFF